MVAAGRVQGRSAASVSAIIGGALLLTRAMGRRAARRARRCVSMKCSSEGLSTARSSGKNEMVAGIAFAMLFAALGAPAAALAADQAAAAASGDWFDPFVNFNAGIIAGIDGVVGSGGVAIILYTIIVKAVTFPLQQPALRTTTLLRLTSPQTETIQKEYKDDEDQKNQMLRRLYDEVGINPLNGLLPVLVQLPIFIALFRAIGRLASNDDGFKQPFLWIPNLSGPVASGNPNLDWLLRSQFSDHFEPLVGWGAALGYLVLPVLIISTTIAAQKLGGSSASTSKDNGWIDTVFPWFIGFSTLVSPQGLGLYWLTNTFLTAGQTFYVKAEVEKEYPEYARIYYDAQKAQQDAPEAPELRYTRESPFQKEEVAEVEVESVVESVKALKNVNAAAPKAKSRKTARAKMASKDTVSRGEPGKRKK